MKPVLSENDKELLEKKVSLAEEQTRSQIVLATVIRSDSYAEIPWKAFALGISVSGLLALSGNLLFPGWIQGMAVLIAVVAMLATGSSMALLTILLPVFARLFLNDSRAETETRQYAESLFLSRQLFLTKHRTGILLLISLFEKKVVIIPDKGISDHVSNVDIQRIITVMKAPLGRNEFRRSMEIAVDELTRIIEPLTADDTAGDELSNRIIEERGL
jgi:putative membrane protein